MRPMQSEQAIDDMTALCPRMINARLAETASTAKAALIFAESDTLDRPCEPRLILKSRSATLGRCSMGDAANIAVFAYEPGDYSFSLEHLTADCVRSYFSDIVSGEVTRYEAPRLLGLNFVLKDALGGGVTRSLGLDAHGKSLSSSLLNMDLPDRLPAPV